jgi:hypothetical protein
MTMVDGGAAAVGRGVHDAGLRHREGVKRAPWRSRVVPVNVSVVRVTVGDVVGCGVVAGARAREQECRDDRDKLSRS